MDSRASLDSIEYRNASYPWQKFNPSTQPTACNYIDGTILALIKMPSSGMSCHVALVRTDVFEERSTSIIRVTRIDELGTTLAVTSNRRTLQKFSC
jgi:hypothetical protein